MTKKELEEEVKQLKKLINTISDNNSRLTEKLNDKEMQFKDTSDYKQMQDVIERLEFSLKVANETIEHKRKNIKRLQDKVAILQDKSDQFEMMYQKLNSSTADEYNSRGAGRKERFTSDDKQNIFKDHDDGLSVRTLAKKYNASVATIQKILKQFK